MSTTVKTITLLFFASGIVLFVGYQSGYFSQKKTTVEKEKSTNDTTHDLVQQERESIHEETEEPDSMMEIDAMNSRPVSETMIGTHSEQTDQIVAPGEELSPEDIRMFSSKSLVIDVPLVDTSGN